MNYWRMSMRAGNQGYDLFPVCRRKGIAAIGYWWRGRFAVNDCRELSRDEFWRQWRKRWPREVSGGKSMEHFAYDMKRGDIIYAKCGPLIAGRGTVVASYAFDPEILRGEEEEWPNFVRVRWDEDFLPFRCLLGAEQCTVLELDPARVAKLKRGEKKAREGKAARSDARKSSRHSASLPRDCWPEDIAAVEGIPRKHLVMHRSRENRLRRARIAHALKKHRGRLRCEVPGCGFDFEEIYGDLGRHYAQVHHLEPLAEVQRKVRTRLKDLAVVCANCHAMIHRDGACRPLSDLIKSRSRRRRQ